MLSKPTYLAPDLPPKVDIPAKPEFIDEDDKTDFPTVKGVLYLPWL